MNEMERVRQLWAEEPGPSREWMARARNRLTDQASENPQGARARTLPLPRRVLVRAATAGTLTVAVAGGLVASPAVDLGLGGGQPAGVGGPGGSDGPAAVANAGVLLDRAAAAARQESLGPARPGHFAYQERETTSRDRASGQDRVTVTRSWMPVDSKKAGLIKTKTNPPDPGVLANPCAVLERDHQAAARERAVMVRMAIQDTPEDFRRTMRKEIPGKLENMSLREMCRAKVGGQDFLQAAKEAYLSKEWRSLAEGSGRGDTLRTPTYAYLRSLPQNPDELAREIRDQAAALREREQVCPDQRLDADGEAGGSPACAVEEDEQRARSASPESEERRSASLPFTLVADALRGAVVPSDTAAALFQSVKRFDGVKVRRDVTLAASGERGVAVTGITNHGSGMRARVELVFHPRTYEFLGTQRVALEDIRGVDAGTVLSSTAIRDEAIVPEKGQVP